MEPVYPIALLRESTAASTRPATIQVEQSSAFALKVTPVPRATPATQATRTMTGTAPVCPTAPPRVLTAASTEIATTREARPFAHVTWDMKELRVTPAPLVFRTTTVTPPACLIAPPLVSTAAFTEPAMTRAGWQFAHATWGTWAPRAKPAPTDSRTTTGMAPACPTAQLRDSTAAFTAPATTRAGQPCVSATRGTPVLHATPATWVTRTTMGMAPVCLTVLLRTAADTALATTFPAWLSALVMTAGVGRLVLWR